MDSTLRPPLNWTVRQTAGGREIQCARRAGEGRFAAWIFIFVLIAICGYGASVFLLGWLAGEEILVGGVVVFVLLLGGLGAGLYLVSAMFRTTTYLLEPQSLSITTAQPVVGQSTQQIQRAMIREVLRLRTPPHGGSRQEVWRTLLAVQDSGGQEKARIALEGESEDESLWLAPLIAEWAGLPVRIEQTDAA